MYTHLILDIIKYYFLCETSKNKSYGNDVAINFEEVIDTFGNSSDLLKKN